MGTSPGKWDLAQHHHARLYLAVSNSDPWWQQGVMAAAGAKLGRFPLKFRWPEFEAVQGAGTQGPGRGADGQGTAYEGLECCCPAADSGELETLPVTRMKSHSHHSKERRASMPGPGGVCMEEGGGQ